MNLLALYRKLTTADLVGGPSLRRRILYSVLLLALYRVLADIPVLHANEETLNKLLADNALVGLVDLLAGGDVLKQFSLVAAGLFPYLVAVALATAATWVIPSWRALRKQGNEAAKKKLDRYALCLSIALAFALGWALSRFLSRSTGLFPGQVHWLTSASLLSTLTIAGLVTLGTLISKGISSLITTQGVGSGEAVVVAAGSSLVFVKQATRIVGEWSANGKLYGVAIAALVAVAIVALTVCLVQGVRKIPVQNAKRQPSARPFASAQSFIPLLVDGGRSLPIAGALGLFALMQLGDHFLAAYPAIGLATDARAALAWATPEHAAYWIVLMAMIVLFTYVANFAVLWTPRNDLPLFEWMRRNGVFIPGVKPGAATEAYLSRVMARITPIGALGLALVAAILPWTIRSISGVDVTVAVLALVVLVKTLDDVVALIAATWMSENYAGILRKYRVARAIDS